MATEYEGDPTATEAPSDPPGDGVVPTLNLPEDGDDLNVSSVYQPFKVLADFAAFCTTRFGRLPGVRTWNASETYTAGMMVYYSGGGSNLTFRVKAGQTATVGTPPSSDLGQGGKWEIWGFSGAELAAYIGALYAIVAGTNAGHWDGPGGIRIQWEYLGVSDLPASPGDAVSHTFAYAFTTACRAAFWQTGARSQGGTGSTEMLVGSLTTTTCTLTLANVGDTAAIASGWLITIGN
jgi:hypothetical protein